MMGIAHPTTMRISANNPEKAIELSLISDDSSKEQDLMDGNWIGGKEK